jgi:hypothetical protein
MLHTQYYPKEISIIMTKIQKTIAITFSTMLGLAIIVGVMLLASAKIIYVNGRLYTQVTNYSPRVPNEHGIVSGCMAMSPECGVCPLLQGDKCYKPL